MSFELRFRVAPRVVLTALAVVVAALTAFSAAAIVYKWEIAPGPHATLMRVASLDGDAGVQSWYQSSSLLLCAGLMFLIAHKRRTERAPYVRHWAVLGVVFAYLSLDEAAEMHELTFPPVRDLMDMGGVFSYAWLLPAALMVLVLGLAYLRFLRDLPSRTRTLVIAAAVVYLGGALVVGALDGIYADHHGSHSLFYALVSNLEEVLEMTGILILVAALLRELAPAERPQPRET